MNKNARREQSNGTHTTGSRRFAVVQEKPVIIQTEPFRLKVSPFFVCTILPFGILLKVPEVQTNNPN
jgi:hypothetical protein